MIALLGTTAMSDAAPPAARVDVDLQIIFRNLLASHPDTAISKDLYGRLERGEIG
jgi:hypothetical protein